MAKHEQVENTVEQSTSEQSEVKIAFNPFALLSDKQIEALSGRFTKAWRKQFSGAITDVATLHGCSTAEASFAVYLQNDADAILTRNKIRETADSITNLLDEVLGKSSEIALQGIETLYASVDAVNRPDVGKRVRENAASTFSLKIADMILSKVYEYLKIKESEWK